MFLGRLWTFSCLAPFLLGENLRGNSWLFLGRNSPPAHLLLPLWCYSALFRGMSAGLGWSDTRQEACLEGGDTVGQLFVFTSERGNRKLVWCSQSPLQAAVLITFPDNLIVSPPIRLNAQRETTLCVFVCVRESAYQL